MPEKSSEQNQFLTLDAIVAELDITPEGCTTYYSKSKKEFIFINEDDPGAFDLPEEELDLTDCIPLPSQYDLKEMRIIKNFIGDLEDKEISDKLWDAIHRSKPFRNFKDAINYFGLDDQWCAYKHDALKEIAKDWCELHEISYVVDLAE